MKKSNRKLSYLWIVLILGLVVFMTSLFRVDPDYFWHIKAGEYMIHHGVLKKDIFSWFVTGKYWMSHEWLFEVFLAFLKNIFQRLTTELLIDEVKHLGLDQNNGEQEIEGWT